MERYRRLYEKTNRTETLNENREDFKKQRWRKRSQVFDAWRGQVFFGEEKKKKEQLTRKSRRLLASQKSQKVNKTPRFDKAKPFVVGKVKHRLYSPPFLHQPLNIHNRRRKNVASVKSFAPKNHKFRAPPNLKKDFTPAKKAKMDSLTPKTRRHVQFFTPKKSESRCSPFSLKSLLGKDELKNVTMRSRTRRMLNESPLTSRVHDRGCQVDQENEEPPIFGRLNLKMTYDKFPEDFSIDVGEITTITKIGPGSSKNSLHVTTNIKFEKTPTKVSNKLHPVSPGNDAGTVNSLVHKNMNEFAVNRSLSPMNTSVEKLSTSPINIQRNEMNNSSEPILNLPTINQYANENNITFTIPKSLISPTESESSNKDFPTDITYQRISTISPCLLVSSILENNKYTPDLLQSRETIVGRRDDIDGESISAHGNAGISDVQFNTRVNNLRTSSPVLQNLDEDITVNESAGNPDEQVNTLDDIKTSSLVSQNADKGNRVHKSAGIPDKQLNTQVDDSRIASSAAQNVAEGSPDKQANTILDDLTIPSSLSQNACEGDRVHRNPGVLDEQVHTTLDNLRISSPASQDADEDSNKNIKTCGTKQSTPVVVIDLDLSPETKKDQMKKLVPKFHVNLSTPTKTDEERIKSRLIIPKIIINFETPKEVTWNKIETIDLISDDEEECSEAIISRILSTHACKTSSPTNSTKERIYKKSRESSPKTISPKNPMIQTLLAKTTPNSKELTTSSKKRRPRTRTPKNTQVPQIIFGENCPDSNEAAENTPKTRYRENLRIQALLAETTPSGKELTTPSKKRTPKTGKVPQILLAETCPDPNEIASPIRVLSLRNRNISVSPSPQKITPKGGRRKKGIQS